MKFLDRLLMVALVTGIWVLIALHFIGTTNAQDSADAAIPEPTVVHASEIVGLSAMVQQTVRNHQFRPQSMPGLDQYIKSVVRNCRITGSISGGRLSSTNISC